MYVYLYKSNFNMIFNMIKYNAFKYKIRQNENSKQKEKLKTKKV